MMRYLAGIAAVVGLLATPPHAWANGKYFASRAVERDPTIASQRAMLAWRGGTQTMIIESVVDGEGQEFGWLLPLPATPTLIEPCTPGALSTLAALIQPSISGSRSGLTAVNASAFVLVIVLLTCLAYAASRSRRSAIASALATTLAALVLVALLLPALSAARGGAAVTGVEVLSASRVGSYDVAIIAAQSGEDACSWLNDRGFSCDERNARILAQYAKEGWCFAAAKLRRSSDGLMSPHPVRVEFATDQMVYPMRLTGVTDRRLQLDLYIVAESRAFAASLQTWTCDSFDLDGSYQSYRGSATCFESRSFGFTLGHPEVIRHFWNGCVLTHLRGELQPEQMREDIHPRLVEVKPTRHWVCSEDAARGFGVATGLVGVSIMLIAVTAVGLGCRANANKLALRTAIGGFAFSALMGIAVYATCDVQPISSGPHPTRLRTFGHQMHEEMCRLANSGGATKEELAKLNMLQWLERDYIRSGDVPFGFDQRETETGWTATFYDAAGVPNTIEIPKVTSSDDLPSS